MGVSIYFINGALSILNFYTLYVLQYANQIFSHFEPVNERTGRCHRDQMEANQCFGGAARIKTAADRIRNEKPDMPSIFLNAGDYYQVLTVFKCHFKVKTQDGD